METRGVIEKGFDSRLYKGVLSTDVEHKNLDKDDKFHNFMKGLKP